jgi:hypothetical protein
MAGLSQDLLTRGVNVQWGGGDVIVVFMDGSYFDPQLFAEHSPIDQKAEFLSTWYTPTFQADTAPLKNSAYKLSSSAGEFMTSIASQLPDGEDRDGSFISALVFAIDKGDVTQGLNRAIEGTKQIAPALYLLNVPNADYPSDVVPAGFLWSVVTGEMQGGVTMTCKIRFGAHRDGSVPSTLPDSMVQCYPNVPGMSHDGYVGDIKVSYSGYFLNAYRLDSGGTGTVYAKVPKVTDEDKTHNIPPEWSQPVATGPFPIVGIPFADPPPLIKVDVE